MIKRCGLDLSTRILLQLRHASDTNHLFEVRGDPEGDRRAPVAVSRDAPVPRLPENGPKYAKNQGFSWIFIKIQWFSCLFQLRSRLVCPTFCLREPVVEPLLLHEARHPVGFVVVGDELLARLLHLDEPARDGLTPRPLGSS